MKRPLAINLYRTSWIHLLALILIAIGLTAGRAGAQDEEEKEVLKSRMSLSAVQGDEGMITLKGLVRAKIDGRYTGLPDLEVSFLSLNDTLEKPLGSATTNEKGIASLTLAKAELLSDTTGTFTLGASFDGNDEFRGSDDEIAITGARIDASGLEEDSVRTVRFTLSSGGEPVTETDVFVYVKSLFNPLKIGEATTDEDGLGEVEFPADLPGDAEGNLRILVRLEEHESFGTVEANVQQAWGTPVAPASTKLPRALWSPSPPLWLLLTFITLLVIIWGHYLEVIYKLFKLRKKAMES